MAENDVPARSLLSAATEWTEKMMNSDVKRNLEKAAADRALRSLAADVSDMRDSLDELRGRMTRVINTIHSMTE